MTAEVAVMNRVGVALAADSAVTIGSAANKIYTSADKLFQLCESAPVGVMVYGNAGYVSLPWETIIKAFRRHLGTSPRPTVADYCTEFVAFLRGHPELFPDENRHHVMKRLLASFFGGISRLRKRMLDKKRKGKAEAGQGDLTPEEVGDAFADALAAVEKQVSEVAEVDGVDAAVRETTKAQVAGCIKDLADRVFDGVVKPAGADDRLAAVSVEYLSRQSLRDYTSGIVIAGFGDEEYMPALARFEVEECVGHLPRMTPVKSERISAIDRPSYIMPFAQQDSVFHFLFGVDTDTSEFMCNSVEQFTTGLVKELLDKVGEADPGLAAALREPVASVVGDKIKLLFDSWEDQQAEYFFPVLDTVAVLPKDELAAMAEAFVNLTKFRRRVTPVAETVSGPIDVAVITKGDGFVWIRRKHYFDPGINPRVMARFLRPGGGP